MIEPEQTQILAGPPQFSFLNMIFYIRSTLNVWSIPIYPVQSIRLQNDGFQKTLIGVDNKEAFDMLLKEVWGPEQAAMGNSNAHGTRSAQHIGKYPQQEDPRIHEKKA